MKLKNILFVLLLFLFLTACMSQAPDEKNEKTNTPQNRETTNTLLGIASFKEFEPVRSQSLKKISNSNSIKTNEEAPTQDEVEEYLRYSYPFDYVKIHSALKFDLVLPEDSDEEALEKLKFNSGLGNLEVTIAHFSTYEYDKEDYNQNNNFDELLLSVTDTLISFRGSRGFYTILNNSYSLGNELNFDDGHEYWLFSSHKTIKDDEIEKDFTPPIYLIQFEKSDDQEFRITFKKDNQILSNRDFYDDESLFYYNINSSSFAEVARDSLYSVYELASLPEAEQIVQILAIDIENKMIEVKSTNDLSVIFIDEYVEYDKEIISLDELWSLLKVGDFLIVSYNEYFDFYQPIYLYPNSIVIS